jgi:hypothetical protein
MSITGAFRQHFSTGDDRVADVIRFTPNPITAGSTWAAGDSATIRTTVNAFGGDAGKSTALLSLWIYPLQLSGQTSSTIQTIYSNYDTTPTPDGWPAGTTLDDKLQYYMRLQDGKLDIKFFRRRLNDSSTTITYNQWNHILLSASIAAGSANAHKADLFHLAVNGSVRTYDYTGGNTTNDFGADYDLSSGSDTLLSSDNVMAFTWGAQATIQDDGPDGSGTVASYYKNNFYGDMFQFYMDNEYLDITQQSNRDMFYDSGSHVPYLDLFDGSTAPAPLVKITDGRVFNSGSNTAINTSLARNNVSKSPTAKP